MEFGREIKYAILIEPTDNKGFNVQVGCGKFAFSNKKDLKEAFDEFIDDPEGFEKKYNKTKTCDVIEGPREVTVGVTETRPTRDNKGYL